ncbi:MAG: MBL fold metallo-hydrolase, partial [Patescibacteria group bacterium]
MKNTKRYTIFLAGVVIAVVLAPSVAREIQGAGKLRIYFFNVGQGDAEFIVAKDGTQILIDGGPNSKVISELGRVMPYYDNSIDVVILTHPHADHVTGLIDVLRRYKVGMVIESGADYDTAE